MAIDSLKGIAIFYIVAPLLKKVVNSLEKAIIMLSVILPGGSDNFLSKKVDCPIIILIFQRELCC